MMEAIPSEAEVEIVVPTGQESEPASEEKAAPPAPEVAQQAEPETETSPVVETPAEVKAAPTPAPEPTETVVAAARSDAQPVPEEPVQELAPNAGLTPEGRAINDPRVNSKPVEVVEITTTHPTLFSDEVAPPATSSGRVESRAVNDPRGPLNDTPMQEAAGQS